MGSYSPTEGMGISGGGGGGLGFCETKIFKDMNQASLEFILNTWNNAFYLLKKHSENRHETH